MSHKIKKEVTIYLTRGDTLDLEVVILKLDEETRYVPRTGDKVRFALKKDYEDAKPLILKDIPIDTMRLHLDPEDTKDLDFGTYVYDIELTYGDDGTVDTFIPKAKFKLTEEVH